MNEITQIDVLPCRDVVLTNEEMIAANYANGVTHAQMKKVVSELNWLLAVEPLSEAMSGAVKETVVKDAIGQDVVVGDVLWMDGRLRLVDGLDATLNKAHLDNVIGRWSRLSDAIRCPRPGELMPYFPRWREMASAMQDGGAVFENGQGDYWDTSPITRRMAFNAEAHWYRRSPSCTWRKPHLGAELKDAQSECVGF